MICFKKKQSRLMLISQDCFQICVFVELEGVEPSSKQGNDKLSTCLSSL